MSERRSAACRLASPSWSACHVSGDPIGVADLVSDEYDCLIAPLVSRLNAGDGRAEISEFLWHELEDHFGLDPFRYDVDGMATAWWPGGRRSGSASAPSMKHGCCEHISMASGPGSQIAQRSRNGSRAAALP